MRMSLASVLLAALVIAGAARADDKSFGKASWLHRALRGQIYFLPADTERLPDFRTLKPVGTIYARSLNVPSRDWQEGFPGITNRFEWFAIEYTGQILAHHKGRYALRLVSDDGSKLYIDDKLVIDNDGVHPATSAEGSIDLDVRPHTIRVQYFQGPRYEVALQLYCTPEGGSERLFPDCDLALQTLPPKVQSGSFLGAKPDATP